MAIDKDKLLAAIEAKAEHAYGNDTDSTIATNRARWIEAYLGLNTNPAPEGRSQVVDRSVFETIHTLLPSLCRIFASGDQVVKFMPVGPEDEDDAEQNTAYVNHVATQLNPWDQIVADWLHDGLLLANGYVYVYWDTSSRIEQETYENLTDDQLAVLVQDGATVLEHDQQPDEEQNQANQEQFAQMMQQYQMVAMQAQQQGQMPPPPPEPPQPVFLHTVVVQYEDKKGSVDICVVPPEHTYVGHDTPDHSLKNAKYFEIRETKTIAELQAMGLEVPEDVSDDMRADESPEDRARNRFGESDRYSDDDLGIMRKVIARTIWIESDADGKESRMYRCIVVGRTVLFVEPVSRIHAVSLAPQPLPHRHPGLSMAETVLDIQDIQTAITRGGLDNLYLANNGRHAISDKVNIDDFLDSRPGGVIRLLPGAMPGDGHIFPIVHPFAFDQIIGSKEYFDQIRQNRAGVSRYFSGTDAGAINKTASGTMALQNMAAQRVEHIARMVSPAFEELFSIVHELISKHQQKQDVIKLNGKWVNVDPSSWQTRRDVKISVGVGAGNKESMLQALNMQFQEQILLAQSPMGIVTPENLYATQIEKAKLQGHANPEKFYTNPAEKPPQPQGPPPEVVIEQMKLQADQQKTQAQMQADAQKFHMEQQQAEQDSARTMQLETAKAEQQAALEKYKADLQAQTQLQIKQMEMGQNVQIKQAELQATKEIKGAEIQNQRDLEEYRVATTPPPEKDDSNDKLAETVAMMARAVEKMSKPKTIIRDGDGRVTGVRVSE